MIDVETCAIGWARLKWNANKNNNILITWYGETAETDGQCQGCDCDGGVARVSDHLVTFNQQVQLILLYLRQLSSLIYHQKDGLHSEAAAVENLADGRGRQDAVAAQVVGQLASDWHDDGHDQMRKGRQCSDFSYVELEDLSEVARLREDEEVECPGSAKVGDDDGVNGRGCEEGAPRCRPEIGDGALDVRQRLLDVEPLAGRDGRMETRLLEREPHPENVPDHSEDAVKVERRLPADSVRQPTGERHADHGAGIRAAKGQSGQSGSLQRRCPPPPDAVAGRVRDSLFELNFFFYYLDPCLQIGFLCLYEQYLDQSLDDADEGEDDRVDFGRAGQEHVETSRHDNGRPEYPLWQKQQCRIH